MAGQEKRIMAKNVERNILKTKRGECGLAGEGKIRKLQRLLKIMLYMESGKPVKASDLAREFGVNKRTIFRDLRTLEEAFHFPYYYDRQRDCYMMVEGSNFSLASITLNFTPMEALSLLLSTSTLAVQKGTPFERTLQGAREKLLSTFPEKGKKIMELVNRRFDVGWGTPVDYSRYSTIFDEVVRAVNENRTISIVYYSLSNDRVTKRKIDPYAVMMRDRVWYVVGRCHLRNDVRIFRVNRIKKVELTGEIFQLPPEFSLEEYMKGSWQVTRGEEVTVRVKFTGIAARFVEENRYHSSQRLIAREEDGVCMEYTVSGTQEIKRWILSFGSEAEVLEPAFLREEINREATALSEKYRRKRDDAERGRTS